MRRYITRKSILANALLSCASLRPGRNLNRILALRQRLIAHL